MLLLLRLETELSFQNSLFDTVYKWNIIATNHLAVKSFNKRNSKKKSSNG